MEFKPGDEITTVYSRLGERYVHLLKVNKVGRKYLHCTTLHRSPNGTINEGHATKVDIVKSNIYVGLRHDIKEAILKHRQENDEWERKRHKKKQEYERDFYISVRKRVAEWVVDNPPPQLPEFPTLEG